MQKINSEIVASKREHIKGFVKSFYARARLDPKIGPIFDNVIGEEWDGHIETITDFWVSVLFGVRLYKGNPFQAHQTLPGLQDEDFDIWLSIFADVADEYFDTVLAALAIEKANLIAKSLRQGLFFGAD